MRDGLQVVEVTPEELDQLPCCGIKRPDHEGRQCKLAWLKDHLQCGLRARILMTEDHRQCGYIEYLPGEHAWRTVAAPGYMFIHCIWTFYTKYQHKGNAVRLVESCIADARKARMNGVAVLARRRPWLASSELFLKCGFEVVEKVPPDYELLVTKFRKTAPLPKLLPSLEKRIEAYGPGLTIVSATQCPHAIRFAREIGEAAERDFGLKPKQVVLTSARDAQKAAPTPYAAFTIIYDGRILTDHQISKTRFGNIMRKVNSGNRK